ncbi:MAG: xanthine dehydrogenase family protein subunit M [Chloroflexi bacterium]|nr:xanthine dehydrogenase family protein subunit M [Chloroflexota bacterium]
MVRFQLLQPHDLVDALAMLAEYHGRARILAGGQSLLVLLKHRQVTPEYLINIKGLSGLAYIKNGDGLRIGALTVHRDIERSPLIKTTCPMLAELEQLAGSTQVRNWGTIGGNLCDAVPDTDPPAALVALGASVRLASARGERVLPLERFITGHRQTALGPDEMLVEIQVPELPPHTGGAYHKESVRLTDPPIIGVAAVVTLDDLRGEIRASHIVLQAVAPTPIRATGAEARLSAEKATEGLIEEAAAIAAREASATMDAQGGDALTRGLKQQLVKVVTRQVVTEAIRRARQWRRGV